MGFLLGVLGLLVKLDLVVCLLVVLLRVAWLIIWFS